MTLIQLRDVCKFYENGAVQAINNLSVTINEGELTALMGPSGCGKTTLLNMIGALDFPEQGNVLIQGKPTTHYRPIHEYRSRMVGFIFQFHHLISSLTLLENVELPMLPLKISAGKRREGAAWMLRATGLEHRMHFFPFSVSGGERQRAAIARALVNRPRIILADEPTGNIDSKTGKKIIAFLIRYCLENKITLVMATHNTAIAKMAQRTMQMRDGRII